MSNTPRKAADVLDMLKIGTRQTTHPPYTEDNKPTGIIFVDGKTEVVKALHQDLKALIPSDYVVTTKYGYNSEEKKYGYRLAVAEFEQAISQYFGQAGDV